MRKITQYLCITIASLFASFAWATPEALPDSAKVTCTANPDGTGTLVISGVDVKHVELYTHAPTSKMTTLAAAATYQVPASTTFNFVWKTAAGEDRYVLLGGEEKQVAKVFATGATGGQFNGVMMVPDAKNGGIGHGGSSMGCSHMLRAKKTS